MKKITLTLKMLLFVALLATWSSCSKSDDNEIVGPTPVNPTPSTPDTPTPSEPEDPYMTVCEHVAEVAKNVDVYYFKSNSLGEMEKYLDEIKSIQYVEDAYASGSEMFVWIKDYGKISYSFFPKPIEKQMNKHQNAMAKHPKRKFAPNNFVSHSGLGVKKIALVAQVQNDEKFEDDISYIELAKEYLNAFSFDVSTNLIAPDVDFFRTGIFDYDFVFLVTHGGFDRKEVSHSFLTSERPSNENELSSFVLNSYKDKPTNQVYFTKQKEIRNGKEEGIWYAMVTEKWIDASPNSFSNRKTIVFNSACHSMQGVGKNSIDSIGYNVSGIFLRKGAGVYFGYDESDTVGPEAGVSLICKLLSGMSLDNAYNDLSFELLHEYAEKDDTHKKDYWADLIADYNHIYPDIKTSCLISPISVQAMEHRLMPNGEFKEVLKAGSYYFYTDYYTYMRGNIKYFSYDYFNDIPDNSKVRYGFYLSETNDVNDAVQLCSLCYGSKYENSNITNYNRQVSFEHCLIDANLKPVTTYNYWAYFYDGKDYYFSNMHSFKTSAKNSSGSGELPNVPGSDL